MDYTIRFATREDTRAVMRFIDSHWRKGHILSRDRELFEWQYGGGGNRLNIVIGIDNFGDIQGMLGFIVYDSSENKDISLALWKANPSTGFLGVRLIKYLMEYETYREIVCPGINLKTTSKIYKYVGMEVGTMSQWYRLAPRGTYVIAKVVDNSIPTFLDENVGIKMILIESIDSLYDVFDLNDDVYTSSIPYKSISYIFKRYFEHPVYKYRIYALSKNEHKANTLLVFRIQDYGGSHALRLIDCIGKCEDIKYITRLLDILMEELECEYVDTYVAGVQEEVFLAGGWRKVMNEGNIIPDYFSPFEHRKIDIHYSSSNPTAILFKGDGDQDRPN